MDQHEPNTTSVKAPQPLYVVIDIETTGPNHVQNRMLCFGAAIGDAATGKIIDTFERYIHIPAEELSRSWDLRTFEEFWSRPDMIATRDAIIARCEDANKSDIASSAMIAFYNWLNNRNSDEIDRMVILTDTAAFDTYFMNVYLAHARVSTLEFILGGKYKPTRDSSSFHAGVGHLLPHESMWGAESAALTKLGLKPSIMEQNPHKADHTPKHDAMSICWEIMKIHEILMDRKMY